MKKLDKGVILWECPRCQYVVTNEIYQTILYDFLCPECEKTHLSEFHIKNMKLPMVGEISLNNKKAGGYPAR